MNETLSGQNIVCPPYVDDLDERKRKLAGLLVCRLEGSEKLITIKEDEAFFDER